MRRVNLAAAAAVITLGLLGGCAMPVSERSVTAYEGARLIVGDGRVIENATVVVEGTKIAQVGAAADVRVPAGARRVNLAGKSVMPMIVDTHVHLSETREALIRDLKQRAYYGVSAALSMGNSDGYGLLNMRDETIAGAARFRTAGRGITTPEPGRSTVPYWITTAAEGRKAVQEIAAHKADIVKIWVDDRDGKYKKLTPDMYGAIIEEAHKRGLRVAAHILSLEDAKGLIRAGLDVFAHGIRDKDIDDEVVAMFKERPNLVLIPNLPDRGVKSDLSWLHGSLPADELKKLEAANTDRPKTQALFGIQARNLAKLNAAGVRITLGTDGNRPWGPHEEMLDMVSCRDDADASHRGGDAQFSRVVAARRRRHAGSRQERRLYRSRRKPARRYHQHATHLSGDLARRGRGPHAAGPLR